MEKIPFRFQWFWFLVFFSAGLLYVYATHPKSPIVLKYPTPLNAGKVVYRDSAGTCYVYVAKSVACTPDAVEQNIVQSL